MLGSSQQGAPSHVQVIPTLTLPARSGKSASPRSASQGRRYVTIQRVVQQGGRKARARGKTRISTDADTRAAACNWSRRATLGVTHYRWAWTAAHPEATEDTSLDRLTALRRLRSPRNPHQQR